MKAIMKLCVIVMPLVGGSIYSAQPHGVQIPTTQKEMDQHLKKIQEINDQQYKMLTTAMVENCIATGTRVPSHDLKKIRDQETLTLAQQHNQKLLEELQRQ